MDGIDGKQCEDTFRKVTQGQGRTFTPIKMGSHEKEVSSEAGGPVREPLLDSGKGMAWTTMAVMERLDVFGYMLKMGKS